MKVMESRHHFYVAPFGTVFVRHVVGVLAPFFLLGVSGVRAAGNEIAVGPDSTNTLQISKIAEYTFAKDGCGGIAWSGRAGVFYVLRDHAGDNRSKVYPVSFAVDPATGAVVEQPLGTEFTPGSLSDAEGLARDPQTGNLWISDESTPTIAEYGLDGIATGRTAPVPAVQRNNKRSNLSLEALTISPDGLTMWTANEQALTCDGDTSSGNKTVSTVVRLTRFTRTTAQAAWTNAGEWAYACDVCGGTYSSESGLSGLCALPDGSLLTLEREVSIETLGRCRIYRITTESLAAATEISDFTGLSTATFTALSKGDCLLEFRGSGLENMIVYEGIALGPVLNDGSRALYLVSDGGATKTKSVTLFGQTITITAVTVSRICALNLTGLGEAAPSVPPFLDWPADPDTQITDAIRPIDLGLVAGGFAESATSTAELRKLSKWASANGVRYAGADVNAMAFDESGNPGTDHATAYLLDCGVEDLEDRKAAFRFTEFVPGTVPSIDASGLNGRVTVLGSDDLSGEWSPATTEHHFFQAVLTR